MGANIVNARLLSKHSVSLLQVIQDNLATDQFFPQAHKSALMGAKQWLAQQWPHTFKLRPLQRDHFLAPQLWLTGADNNTSNPVHRREKHGMPINTLYSTLQQHLLQCGMHGRHKRCCLTDHFMQLGEDCLVQ